MKSLPLIVVLSLFATHAAATWEALPDSAIAGIRLMFNVLPAVFFLGGGLVMFFYRIDRATLTRVETELHDRRAAPEVLAP